LFSTASAASTLDEELDRLSEDVKFEVRPVLRVLSAPSILADDDDIESELVLIAVSAASTLEEELLRFRLEV
jgi:hypothetical protein